LKEVVFQGWSKQPNERPSLEEFKSALNARNGETGKAHFNSIVDILNNPFYNTYGRQNIFFIGWFLQIK
jgi:hypothetical protein